MTSDEAVDTSGATCTAKVRRRTKAFLAAVCLEQPSAWLDGGLSLRLAIIRAGAAAKDCRGMNLGTTVLGPAFRRIEEFVRASFEGNVPQPIDEEADLVLTAMECGIAMAGAMWHLDCFGAAEAHLGHIAAAYGRTVLSGYLRLIAALTTPGALPSVVQIGW